MDWLQLTALALIQGLTEFLPISSSAHLILPNALLGWPDQGLAFDVAVHVGTLMAVMWAFRHDLGRLIRGWGGQFWPAARAHQSDPEAVRLGWAIIVATVPACIAGLLLGDWIELHLRSAVVIGWATLIFGVLLGWADRYSGTRQLTQMTLKLALVIGLFQAFALIPGTSRSGITITAALLLGFSRQEGARFSFLLSIPLIIAAGLFKGIELYENAAQAHWLDMAWGVLLSFLSAWLCIRLFLHWLDRIGMMPFVIYRLCLAGVLLAMVYWG